MAEFDDLLAGIRAFPADELRRLVFADWLDENAHAHPVYGPWASYIRWAIAATRTPRNDPDYWKYRRYPESPPEGVAELLGCESRYYKFEWHAGFPDQLTLATDTLRQHDRRLASMAGPIRRLIVSADSGRIPSNSSTSWASGPTVARSGALDVMLNASRAIPVLNALAAQGATLPPLSLSLPGTVDVIDVFARQPFPSLVGLAIDRLDDADQLSGSPNLGSVTTFSISGPPRSYAALPAALPNLTWLCVRYANLEEFLAALAGGAARALSRLEISTPTAHTPGWKEFVTSPAFGRLSRLHLTEFVPDTVTQIWPVGVPEPDPGDLILNVSSLRAVQSAAVVASPLLHRCAFVFLERCELTSDAYVALAENPSARNLKVLSIQMPFKSEPVASGEPFAALCQSPHLAGLTELSLTFHSLTDDDFGQLLTATFAGNLRYLNLAGSYFSERMLARLLDPDVMPALTWLDIHGPKEPNHPLGVAYRKRFGPNFAF